jgi:CRISPR system Cascade subunit CasE
LIGHDRTVAPHSGKALMWAAFDNPDGERDFLWREAGDGVFYTLSNREPIDAQGLFAIDPPKEFSPSLKTGDDLSFSLRVNPVVRRKSARNPERSVKHDVMMDALQNVPREERKEKRDEVGRQAVLSWLRRQGKDAGFTFEDENVVVTAIRQHEVPKSPRRPVRFTAVDLDGRLRVTEPALFIEKIGSGFGSAKAYGCGLMMIRRSS